jgi:hypothetical protein
LFLHGCWTYAEGVIFPIPWLAESESIIETQQSPLEISHQSVGANRCNQKQETVTPPSTNHQLLSEIFSPSPTAENFLLVVKAKKLAE